MTSETMSTSRYPLLEPLLTVKGLPLQAIYTIRDAARIFDVTPRTIQGRCHDGRLACRDLLGRGRFLSEDVETFLRNSLRKPDLPRE